MVKLIVCFVGFMVMVSIGILLHFLNDDKEDASEELMEMHENLDKLK